MLVLTNNTNGSQDYLIVVANDNADAEIFAQEFLEKEYADGEWFYQAGQSQDVSEFYEEHENVFRVDYQANEIFNEGLLDRIIADSEGGKNELLISLENDPSSFNILENDLVYDELSDLQQLKVLREIKKYIQANA